METNRLIFAFFLFNFIICSFVSASSYEIDLTFYNFNKSVYLNLIKSVPFESFLLPNQSCNSQELGYYTLQFEFFNETQNYNLCFLPSYILLSNPPTILDSLNFRFYIPNLGSLQSLSVTFNFTLVSFFNLNNSLCNNNQICENSYIGSSNMFENYLSCPSDCSYFDFDGTCNIDENVSYYSFNDGQCDFDCPRDIELEGECFYSSCIDFGKYTFSLGNFIYDSCKDESTLIENYCGVNLARWDFWNVFERVAKSKEVSCEFGCFDGACLENPEIPSSCTDDSDCSIGEVCVEGVCIMDESLPLEPEKPGRF